MRIIFMGSPQSVVNVLKCLLEAQKHSDLQLVGVVSQPAKAQSRSKTPISPPVAEFAERNNLPLLQPDSAKDVQFLDELRKLEPDVIVTAAYGQILNDAFLQIPKRATINIHPSLLPKYRGATPVAAALLDGLKTTGVSILFTVKKLDAGNLIVKKEFAIGEEETCGELTERLFKESGALLLTALEKLRDPKFEGEPQDESQVTFCHKMEKQDGLIDWQETAAKVYSRFRAFSPWPGSFTFCEDRRIAVKKMQRSDQTSGRGTAGDATFNKSAHRFEVSCKSGVIYLLELLPAGGKLQSAQSFYNGLKDKGHIRFHGPSRT